MSCVSQEYPGPRSFDCSAKTGPRRRFLHRFRMTRANRYIVPGFPDHLTQRCHNRKFLLRYACDRQRYRIRLREALLDYRVALLTYNYNITRKPLMASGLS